MRSASLLWSPAASALSMRSLESEHLTKQTNLASDGLGEFTVGASEPVSWVYFVALRMNWMSPTASKRCRCHGPLENTTFPSDRQKNAPLISPVRCMLSSQGGITLTVLLHFTSSIAIAFGKPFGKELAATPIPVDRQTRAVLAGRLQPEKNLIGYPAQPAASPTISDRRPHSAAPCSRCRNLPVIPGPDQR
ncbi:uncharacterized protein B0T23DRAFT_401312 [Neurospora hispaniola]|uniref:Uncharacterized protein n=1 Tax=Neurospora hispaniola TaxID=588809 RepID=A0AAJ0IG67_9PEZI|nr:hypothetical protein B0T23DRAFT_401312 [Neurospora hispaniola]